MLGQVGALCQPLCVLQMETLHFAVLVLDCFCCCHRLPGAGHGLRKEASPTNGFEAWTSKIGGCK